MCSFGAIFECVRWYATSTRQPTAPQFVPIVPSEYERLIHEIATS